MLPPELNPRGPGRALPASREPAAGGGWRRQLTIVSITLAVVVLAASGVLYTRYLHYGHNIHRAAGVIKPGGAQAKDGAQNVLLVGSDSRDGTGDEFAQAGKGQEQVEGQRSDTVILAHIAAGDKQATLVSLPRDSWVTIPAYTDSSGRAHAAHQDKLNAAFSLGGRSLLVATVQQLTGIHIDHYAEIDFAGFQNMVNALGGVEVCLTQPAHDTYTGINLSAGNHHLDGMQALQFVRQRYGLPLGDLDRIKRQQQFLGSMMREVESAGTLANPFKLNAFLDALTKSITVDQGMSLSDMTKLALKLKGLSSGNVILTTLPISGFPTIDGQSVDTIDDAKAAALFDALKNDDPVGGPQSSAPSDAPLAAVGSVHVRVFNGAGVQGLAGSAASDLTKLGFVVVGTPANRGTGATTTVINYGPTQAAQARTLAAAIPGATLKADPQLGADLELVLGSSYKGANPPGSPSAPSGAAANAAAVGGTTAADASCTA